MDKRVYLETTIPSFYYTLRTDTELVARMNWTRRWWCEFARQFRLVSSHLANPNKMQHIRLVNYELALPMPLLTTPLNYLSGDESDA